MKKDGYYGDFGSFAEEQRAYEQHTANQEPNCVPCFKCGDPMYEEKEEPKEVDVEELLKEVVELTKSWTFPETTPMYKAIVNKLKQALKQ